MGKAVCCVRFTARGQVRSRRAGFGLSEISSIASRTAFASLRGGKSRLPGNLAADNAERADERHSVRIEFDLVRGFAHQVPYAVVGKEKSPYLLLDQFWLTGAQDHPRAALVRLELIEHEFRLPALMISRSKFGSRYFIRVCDIGDQGYDLLAISPVRDLVIDDPSIEPGQVGYFRQPATKPVRVLGLLLRIRDEQEIGTIWEPFQYGQVYIRTYPE